MRNRVLALLAAITVLQGSPGYSTEVDNFTDRDRLTHDALEILDAKVNKILDGAIRQANKESPDYCNRVLLRQEIVRWTGPDPVSLLELWATLTDDIQRTSVTFAESVYQDATFLESPGMRVFGIGRTFKLAGHVIGTDKLGHFFMQGLDYFKRVQVDGADLEHVLRFEHGEDGIWGLGATGVKSYGDMATNFAGYRFWSSLYQGPEPYARCQDDRRWVKARSFTWADYVTDAWDEAINCSEMVPTLSVRVQQAAAKLGVACPIDALRCFALARLEKAEFIVNPFCLSLREPKASARPSSPRVTAAP